MHLELIAFVAGLISSTAAIPQLHRMIKTKKTGAVSTYMFAMKNVSNSLWIAFGIYSGVFFVVFWNAVSFSLCTAVIVLKYKITREKERLRAQDQKSNIVALKLIPKMEFNDVDPIQLELESRKHLKLVYSKPQQASATPAGF